VEFRELLRRRRMVRSYADEPVPRETIERIVGTVRRAPSAGFSQGHRLYVVTAASTRQSIAQLAGEDEYAAMGHERWISAAPVHVVVGVREESYHERYRQPDKLVDGEEIGWPAPYWYVDAGSLFMLVQLAALDEGLGTGIFGVAPKDVPPLRELVGMPEDVHFVCVLTIGHRSPQGDDAATTSRLTRRRLALDELVFWVD
jgi:FMN reductase [NAD(P)H]